MLMVMRKLSCCFPNYHPFWLYLSSNITLADYNMGYCLTGTLERGDQHANQFQTTHFAVIRRCWPASNDGHDSQTHKTQHTYIDFLFNR
ncbi:conserved hypothetical protein [Culex quinquefasciatus]|uniref:Uncharacterized protein n=1 Tax=Culex quinquefasciatus TaxID=7176 RepID=B0X258_CULQU|nr:conserved hypothetical protein [Culex quinquefasciatus]|eukprot:XP_001863730.1 conserved hypothetical protein [Culex quinquefasciatus]